MQGREPYTSWGCNRNNGVGFVPDKTTIHSYIAKARISSNLWKQAWHRILFKHTMSSYHIISRGIPLTGSCVIVRKSTSTKCQLLVDSVSEPCKSSDLGRLVPNIRSLQILLYLPLSSDTGKFPYMKRAPGSATTLSRSKCRSLQMIFPISPLLYDMSVI